MADQDLISKEVGELSLKLAFDGEKDVVLSAKYEGKGGSLELRGELKKAYVLQKVKDLIPGKVDDMIIDTGDALLSKV